MTRYHDNIERMDIDTLIRARKWLGWLLIVGGGLLLLMGDRQSHLSTAGGNLIVGATMALSLALAMIYGIMKRAPSTPPLALLDLVGFLARAVCAVAGAVCAWAGLWSMTCAFWGLGLNILPERAARYVLLSVPLFDNGDEDALNAGSIWARLTIDGDGINILIYKERPGTLDDEPMSRVLVECHRNQLRVLGWPEGVSIDDEPKIVAALVADVLGYQPPTASEPEEEDG